MIYYNLNTINDWNFGDDNIIKVYKHGAVCYYKITSGDTPTPVQEPCYAVVDDITKYTDTEFEDVFNKADEKWYKLNNLNQYEEYGVYGSGRTITTYDGKLTIDNCDDGEDYSKYYLTLQALESGTIGFSAGTVNYSTDSGSTWNALTQGNTISVNQGDEVLFKMSGATPNSNTGIGTFTSSGRFNVYGNIMSMQESDNFATATTIANYEYYFKRLFAESKAVSAENMVLPATTLRNFCYNELFKGSTYLTTPPKIFPATALTQDCYSHSFRECTSLTKSPILPALTSARASYGWMFQDCTSLSEVTCLATNVSAQYATYDWLKNVASSGTFYKNPNASWSRGTSAIPSNWSAQDYVEPTPIKYEYIYSGGSWVNVGEVSGGTATLPDVSFSLNYNAKEYDSTNNQIPQTSGQLQNVDAVCNYGYHIIDHSADGYISITGNSRFICSGNSGTYLNRTNTQTGCTMTIVSKAKTNSGYSILTNRQGNGTTHLNWMYRQYADGYMKLHGKTDTQQIACSTTEPNILSVRTLYNGGVKSYMNNWSLGTSTSQATFAYLNTGTRGGALFCDYSDVNTEFWQGDFYWVYMSQNVLTDEQVQQVINYNEGGGGEPVYPLEYVVREDPPNNLTFSSMTEAESYECPWVGMVATIDGVKYVFSGDSQSGYEWVEQLTAWYTLQDLIDTHTIIDKGNNKYELSPTVNGIAFFRVHTDKVSGSGTFVDLYNDNLPSPPYFGIKDDSNITLYTSVDGYSNLKSAANSSTCTWAYWIDTNTIEVNAQAIMNDTMNIGFYTGNYPKLLLSFELPTV